MINPFIRTRVNPGSIDCVLFDLDGTLIDTTDLIFRSYQHALRAILDRSATDEELYLGYGQPLTQAFGEILSHQGLAYSEPEYSDVVQRLITAYRAFNIEHHDALAREFPGVRLSVAELARRGYTLGLVTSKSRSIAKRGLALIGLVDTLHASIFMEDTARHKPHPDPVLAALNRLFLHDRRAQTLFVGDSTHDLIAGRAAGVRTGAAMWGPFPAASLLALQPDHAFTRIEDVLELCPERKR